MGSALYGGKSAEKTENEKKKHMLNDSLYSHLKYNYYIYTRKYPVILEDYLGWNLRYSLTLKSVGNILLPVYWFRIQYEAKNRIIEGESDILIENFFKLDKLRVDDVLEMASGQRAVHFAVLFDDDELMDYLIKNDAHLMARDWNGYTALLKASALGRLGLVKKLVEAGVPPFHKDPWGVNALDKAQLFNQREVVEYLNNIDKNVNKEKIEMWKKKSLSEKYDLTPWFMKQF
jgi:hypothetical protein